MEKLQIAQINEYKELMKTLRDEHDELVTGKSFNSVENNSFTNHSFVCTLNCQYFNRARYFNHSNV